RWPTMRSSPSGGRGDMGRGRARGRGSTPTNWTSAQPRSPTPGAGRGGRSRRPAGAGAPPGGGGGATRGGGGAPGRSRAACLARVPESGERARLAIEGSVQLLELGWRFGISAEESAALFAEGEALARGSGDLGALARLVNAYGVLRSHFGSAEDFVEAAR